MTESNEIVLYRRFFSSRDILQHLKRTRKADIRVVSLYIQKKEIKAVIVV